MVVQPLRGYGPRVFISYSFADAPLAQQVESSLAAKGFQVRREDEVSLFNEKLTEAIPRRMADGEVFIQLLTPTANRSQWVKRELEWMLEQRKAGTGVAFLPIVFDKSTLPAEVGEWWYMDVNSDTLTEAALDAIGRFCLNSVHLLRLAVDDPLSVRNDDLEKLLTDVPKDAKRIIFDSDGKLVGWAQETIACAEGMDSEYRDSFLAQEKGRYDRLIRRLKILDEVVRKLTIEVMREMRSYTNEPIADGKQPMNNFVRILLSDFVVTASEVAPPEPHPLRTAFKDRIESARASNAPNYSAGFLNPGLYAWVFGEKGGEESMCLVDLDSPDFRAVSLAIPRRVFGDMADIYTRHALPFDPRSELLSGTFINYVMPQIAVHAAYNLTAPDAARRDLEEQYAWRLEQYTKMGMS